MWLKYELSLFFVFMLSLQGFLSFTVNFTIVLVLVPMMMIMSCGLVDWRKAFNLISSRDLFQRPSLLRISDTLRTGFEFAQNLSSGFVESSCAVVIVIAPHMLFTFLAIAEYQCCLSLWQLQSKYQALTWRY